MTGKIAARKAVLAAGASVLLRFEFVASSVAQTCVNTAWATAARHRYVSDTAELINWGFRSALLRDATTTTVASRPDFGVIFPLVDYIDPIPGWPFTDESGLLDDPTRPFVLYGLTGPETLYLAKDGAAAVRSIVISR